MNIGVGGDKTSIDRHLSKCKVHREPSALKALLDSINLAHRDTPLPLYIPRPLPGIEVQTGWHCSVCDLPIASGGTKYHSHQIKHIENCHPNQRGPFESCQFQKWFAQANSTDRTSTDPLLLKWHYVRVGNDVPPNMPPVSDAASQNAGFEALKKPTPTTETIIDRREQGAVVNRFNMAPLVVVETMRSHLFMCQARAGTELDSVNTMAICKTWVKSVNDAADEIPDATRIRLASTSSVFIYFYFSLCVY